MIEIKVTGESYQDCLNQMIGFITEPVKDAPAFIPAEPVTTLLTAEPPVPEMPTPEEAAEYAKKTAEKAKKAAKEIAEKAQAETTTSAPEAPAEAQTEASEPVSEAPAHKTYDEVYAIATKVRNDVSIGALRLLLSSFNGAQKVKQLQESDYDGFYAACEKRIAEGK